jgi:hypothetical protein
MMASRTEEPDTQAEYIQQCLEGDKRPIGLLLGAGCPTAIRPGGDDKPPLIPAIKGITDIVTKRLSEDKECSSFLKTVEGHFKKDGRSEVTVEDILSHIRALHAVAGNDDVRGLSAAALDKLDTETCRIIHEITDKTLPGEDTPYHRIASWVEATKRGYPVEIFTTNYDLLMEQAFESSRVPYFDGFGGVLKPFFDLRAMEEDLLPSRWARLWKLHGSINWYHAPTKGVFRGTPTGEKDIRRVIHPSHLKYEESRRMPYLAMIDRLRAFLKQPTAVLLVIGYSFRDEHINEVIIQGLQHASTSAVAFALLYDRLAEYPQAEKLAQARPNLAVLARDGCVISGRKATWPTKRPEALTSGHGCWVKWNPVDPAKADSDRRGEFWLGDFGVFGQFLHELVGHTQQQIRITDVK